MTVNISWHKPTKHWFKLNIDGTYKIDAQKSGVGDVIRNHTGKWILGIQMQHITTSPLPTELQAIHERLQIANKYYLFPLEVETDSTEAIMAIQQDHLVLSNLVVACRSLMHHRKDLLLLHKFRKGNQVAHMLAKDAAKENYKQLSLQY
uniref:Uncharacterized protein LOC104248826 n=1 Tax=Nicotiana sylvestris TaxID=4096 RepID=A0A1U7YXJ3_NICSY|nr:PREDICTED: uncharacterized protein LOC104248826 [Nicotiana sylvestris]